MIIASNVLRSTHTSESDVALTSKRCRFDFKATSLFDGSWTHWSEIAFAFTWSVLLQYESIKSFKAMKEATSLLLSLGLGRTL